MTLPATDVLRELAAHPIPWGLLGTPPPAGHRGHDLDVVVRSEDLPAFERAVARACRALGGDVVNVIAHAAGARMIICAWWESARHIAIVRVDVHTGLSLGGRRFLSAKELLRSREPVFDGAALCCWALAPSLAFICATLKRVHRGALGSAARADLEEMWRRDPGGAARQLRRFWSSTYADLIARAAGTGDWSRVGLALPQLRRAMRAPPGARWHVALAEARRFSERLHHPTGLVVAFLGIDGSGKSTVIAGLRAALSPLFTRTQSHHFKPQVLGVRPSARDGPFVHPPGKSGGVSLQSVVRLVYYLLDYWVGFPLKVWPQRLRSGLALFDRYFFDLAIDPVRLRHAPVMALAGRLGRLVPAPDLLILLDTAPEDAATRKGEVPPAPEAARQRQAYCELVEKLPYGHAVRGAGDREGVVREVRGLILRHLSERVAQRQGVDPLPRGASRRQGDDPLAA